MQDKDNPSDPSASWPEEVKKAYDQLKVPSLYDFVATNEKLGLEIRKQNRDLKSVEGEIQKISAQMNSIIELLSEEWELVEEEGEEGEELVELRRESEPPLEFTDLEIKLLTEKQDEVQRKMTVALIETTDQVIALSKEMDRFAKQLSDLLPKKEGILSRTPKWRGKVEELLNPFSSQIDLLRHQMIERLGSIDIRLIIPQPGDPFIPQKHRVLEKVPGGPSGSIARLVRPGYLHENQVLRLAEVIVYL